MGRSRSRTDRLRCRYPRTLGQKPRCFRLFSRSRRAMLGRERFFLQHANHLGKKWTRFLCLEKAAKKKNHRSSNHIPNTMSMQTLASSCGDYLLSAWDLSMAMDFTGTAAITDIRAEDRFSRSSQVDATCNALAPSFVTPLLVALG